MNPHQSDQPPTTPDLSSISEKVGASIRSHQSRIRVLTSVALLMGILAIAASVAIVSVYFVFYRPKEKEVLRQVTLAAEQAKQSANAENATTSPSRLPFDYPSVQATMTFLHSLAIAFLAGAVGILGLGTLLLVTVIVLPRRTTLEQINASLAQISNQLKELPSRGRT
jgi:hypothetical protein